MGVEITGLKRLEAKLEEKFGQARMQEIADEALLKGAEVIKRELQQNFETFRDTGASIDEITISEPKAGPNGRRREIHWVGPKGRYRLIHINEWGTIKNPNPAGKGRLRHRLKARKKLSKSC